MLINDALEECLRFHGPGFLLFTRYAMIDTPLGGTPVPRGMPIFIINQAAGYDPEMYPDPMRFNIHRHPLNIPTFGGGVHHCIGNRLGRLVLQITLKGLFSRFPKIQLDDPNFIPHYIGALSETQLETLPLRLY